MTEFRVVALSDRPDLIDAANDTAVSGWPEFMLYDTVADQYFGDLYNHLTAFQFVLVTEEDRVAGVGNTVPVVWDGTTEGLPARGWDWALESGVRGYHSGIKPTTLCAIQAVVGRDFLGQGLSQQILKGMRALAVQHGLNALIAPVRPNMKHLYPLTPMENYIRWSYDGSGAPFDSWLRTHWKLGARIQRVCTHSMTIPGSVSDWEIWTNMRFPESGAYIVPGALVPVEIDREMDTGRYVEPNVWMLHQLES